MMYRVQVPIGAGTKQKSAVVPKAVPRQFQGSSSVLQACFFKYLVLCTHCDLGSSEVREKGGGGHYFLTHHTTVQVQNIMTHIVISSSTRCRAFICDKKSCALFTLLVDYKKLLFGSWKYKVIKISGCKIWSNNDEHSVNGLVNSITIAL